MSAEKHVAYTICANNYLAHAITLAKSFKAHHNDVEFIICLVDKPDESIDYSALGADTILWVPDVLECDLEALGDRYTIAELCTVVKPNMFQYFFKKRYQKVLYLDPDIKVYSRFTEVLDALDTNICVLTPHICSPTPASNEPNDHILMRTGVYNLGFLGLRNDHELEPYLAWWDKRVKKHGIRDSAKGYFFDQIWMVYAPAFLSKVKILRHLGYNAANWNLHERKFEKAAKGFLINQKQPLVFFHFSHYKLEVEPSIASYNKSFNLENRLDIAPLFLDYKEDLLKNGYNDFKKLGHAFGKQFLNAQQEAAAKNKKSKKDMTKLQRAKWHLKRAVYEIVKG